jgi:phage terminase small subunit
MGALRDPRHECYARELAAGSRMRLAWITSGFPETSRNWARLARRRSVARRIEELRAEFNEAAGIHLRYIQEKLLAIASADVTNYFRQNDWGTLSIKKNLAELPAEQRAAIAELTINKGGQVSLKLESKSKAIDTLLKTLPGALAAGKVEVSGPNGAPLALLLEQLLHPDTLARLEDNEVETLRLIAYKVAEEESPSAAPCT